MDYELVQVQNRCEILLLPRKISPGAFKELHLSAHSSFTKVDVTLLSNFTLQTSKNLPPFMEQVHFPLLLV